MFYQFNLGLFNRPPFWQNKAKFPNDLNGEKVWPPSTVLVSHRSASSKSPVETPL